MRKYDICIIGGGISGLCFAKKVKEINPKLSVLILEKESRFGGRLQNAKLNGVDIVEGAGVGRKGKDHHLLSLVQEMGIKTKEVDSKIEYASTLRNNKNNKNDKNDENDENNKSKEFQYLLKTLKEKAKPLRLDNKKRRMQNFSQFAQNILGDEGYSRFQNLCGFTDYIYADVIDTLDHYGFDDNYNKQNISNKIVLIPWTDLIQSLVQYLKSLQNVLLKKNCFVKNVKHVHDYEFTLKKEKKANSIQAKPSHCFQVKYNNKDGDKEIRCNKVVMGTTIEPMFKLLPRDCMNTIIQDQIASQPFIRVYAHIDTKSAKNQEFIKCINAMTIVPNILQKIIPINKDKGVYMIAYADNKNAVAVQKMLSLRNLEKLVKEALDIQHISIKNFKSFYWKEGTHYFNPLSPEFKNRKDFLNRTISPCPNVYILGEGFSNNQGWTEGALERIANIFEYKSSFI